MSSTIKGIPKIKLEDAGLQRTIDALIEAVEILGGLKKNDKRRAVSFLDLEQNGFGIDLNPQYIARPGAQRQAGSSERSINIPSTSGPTTAPTDLAGALLPGKIGRLTWTPPSANVEYTEVWLAYNSSDIANANLHAVVLGPVYSELFRPGTSTTHYYWVRAKGTDGNYSGFVGPVSITYTT